MEITSTSELLTQTPADAAPQSPPMSKPRSASVSLPAVDDDREPASPHYRAEPPGAPSTHHGQWRRMILATGVVVALAALVVGIHYYVSARGPEATDAVVDGHIVHVVPQVAGRVLQVLVTDNQPVQAGDLLVQIDPVDFMVKVDLSIAVAAEARGRLEQARWQLLVAEAAQALAEDEVVAARARGKSTAAKRASAQLTVAQLKAVAAVAQVNLARAQIETATAGVAAAEAALTQAGTPSHVYRGPRPAEWPRDDNEHRDRGVCAGGQGTPRSCLRRPRGPDQLQGGPAYYPAFGHLVGGIMATRAPGSGRITVEKVSRQAVTGGAGVFALSLIFIFLILATLYESWSLPFSVLLSIPVAVCAAEHARQGAAHNDEYFSAVIRTMQQMARASSLPAI